MSALLTKSRFVAGRQCLKRLWLEAHGLPGEGSGESTAKINGRAVDQVVQSLQPGVIVSREEGVAAAAERTRPLLGMRLEDRSGQLDDR